MILVTFSLPQESADFRAALQAAGGQFGSEEIRVAHLGVGPAAAQRARRALEVQKPRTLICAGFAGGLDPRLRVGDLVIAGNFSTSALRERAKEVAEGKSARFLGSLITRDAPIETVAAKIALARESGALAVDMETAGVAEVCRAAGMPLLAVRAISDAADAPLPVPFSEWFDLNGQRPRRWRLVKYLVRHPTRIVPFVTFVRGLAPARRALADFLIRFLGEPV